MIAPHYLQGRLVEFLDRDGSPKYNGNKQRNRPCAAPPEARTRSLTTNLLIAMLIRFRRVLHAKFACRLLAALLSVAGTGAASYAQTEPAAPTDFVVNDNRIHGLIQQLAATRFSDRERATNELIEAGVVAVGELQLALEDRDREVRRRAAQAIVEIARRDRPRRLAIFVRGLPVEDAWATPLFGIPGMDLMFSIAGDTPDSRKILTSALQRDWDFCEAVLDSTALSARLIDAKCAALRSRHGAFPHESRSPGDLIAVLLGVVRNPDATSDSTAVQIYGLINQLEFTDWNQDRQGIWSSAAFRRLIGEFILRCEGPTATYQGLNMSLRYNLPEGLHAAERVLRDEQSLPFVRQYAILTVARFGNCNHLADLHRLINDHQVCFTRRTTLRHSNFECQVRDLALASMLHLLGRDPRQFGFVHLQRSENYVFQPHTVGFDSDEDRMLALLQFQLSTTFLGLR